MRIPRRGQRFEQRFVACVLIAATLIGATACRKKPHAPTTPPAPFAPAPGWTETGVASWYGDPYHGRQSANGEIYDMEQMTAAHRTLKFGANLRVTNLSNHKQVEVRITDRGPFVDQRIIDLSRAAARGLDMIGPGTARVKIELLSYGPERVAPPGGLFGVQVGAFAERSNADALARRLTQHYSPVEVRRRNNSRAPWRVVVGSKHEQSAAEELADALRREYKDVYVVRLDESGN
ncbi:MAG: septal ring lytic transglycosylase RlpA family protein [Acidobacteria bacterium]|nr:septal ring lytic transglycosylase RlpA family protein [Acidobacteriota bacterium]